MRNRNLVLGSVASFAFTSVLLAAAPSIAQSLPRESTPAERAATESLNAQQASQPDIIVGVQRQEPASVPADVAAYNAQVAQNNAADEARYNAQLKDYQDKKQAYDQQNQNYQQQLGSYKEQLANPPVIVEEQHVIVDKPVIEERHVIVDRPAVVTVAPPFPGKPLIDLNHVVEADVAGLPVTDRGGAVVGHLSRRTFQDGGRLKAVITLNNNKSVAVSDDHVRFDPDRNIVVADLTFDELNHMPARF